MITGLSLSKCVASIIHGDIKEKDVKKIIAGIYAPDFDTYINLCHEYAIIYWQENQEKAIEVAINLWRNNKIDQPRLRKEGVFFTGDGPWVDETDNTFQFLNRKRVYSGNKLTLR